MYLFMSKVLSAMSGASHFDETKGVAEEFTWIQEITQAIDTLLWPLLIVVAACGTIYAVVLGVNMARADSTEKREEAKKRLINLLIGIAITIGLILFFKLLITTILPSFGFDAWKSTGAAS